MLPPTFFKEITWDKIVIAIRGDGDSFDQLLSLSFDQNFKNKINNFDVMAFRELILCLISHDVKYAKLFFEKIIDINIFKEYNLSLGHYRDKIRFINTESLSYMVQNEYLSNDDNFDIMTQLTFIPNEKYRNVIFMIISKLGDYISVVDENKYSYISINNLDKKCLKLLIENSGHKKSLMKILFKRYFYAMNSDVVTMLISNYVPEQNELTELLDCLLEEFLYNYVTNSNNGYERLEKLYNFLIKMMDLGFDIKCHNKNNRMIKLIPIIKLLDEFK